MNRSRVQSDPIRQDGRSMLDDRMAVNDPEAKVEAGTEKWLSDGHEIVRVLLFKWNPWAEASVNEAKPLFYMVK